MDQPKAKRLTPDQRNDILRRLKSGLGVSQLAREYGVSQSAISQIKARGVRTSRTTTSAGTNVGVRLSPAEIEALAKLKAKHGFASNSDTMRSLLRMGTGLLEFDQASADGLDEIKAELHKIGVNVNQIALAANRGRTDLVQQQWAAINGLRRALPEVRAYLKAVVDEQRRRGIRLYEKFGGAGDV